MDQGSAGPPIDDRLGPSAGPPIDDRLGPSATHGHGVATGERHAATGPTAQRQNDDLYVTAGLPRAIYSTKTQASPTAQRLNYDGQIGTAVHEVLAAVVEECQRIGYVASAEHVSDISRRRASDIPGRGDRAYLRVVGLVSGYLSQWLPNASTMFVGAEMAVPNGRVDLAWLHPVHGTFYDEVKTWKHDRPTLDAATLGQVEKYMDAGIASDGEDFAGVRLLTLGSHASALWFRPNGLIEVLGGSDLDIATRSSNAAGRRHD